MASPQNPHLQRPSTRSPPGPCVNRCSALTTNREDGKGSKGSFCLECYSERICGMSIDKAAVMLPLVGLVASVIVLIICIVVGINVLALNIIAIISYVLAINAVQSEQPPLQSASGLLLLTLIGESIFCLILFIITLLPYGLIVLVVGGFKIAIGFNTFLAISSLSMKRRGNNNSVPAPATATRHVVVDFSSPPPQYSPPAIENSNIDPTPTAKN
ncbi:hypothetical protein MP638_005426 [Amoeboaphelidium occidentale]|nr:hypothetical protein MP638_005426 [Amoeboaphelidium occidentale]